MIKYCRACDLGFCERHTGAHLIPKGQEQRHELKRDERVDFCAVCVGIWKEQS